MPSFPPVEENAETEKRRKTVNWQPYSASAPRGLRLDAALWSSGLQPFPRVNRELFLALLSPALFHVVGHIAACISFTKVFVSFTHVIKALEPVFFVLFSALHGQFYPIHVWLSVLPVVNQQWIAGVTSPTSFYTWILLSGVFYHLYNQSSYQALDEISPLIFSVGKTMKSVVAVIIASVIAFRNPARPQNALGSTMAIFGAFFDPAVLLFGGRDPVRNQQRWRWLRPRRQPTGLGSPVGMRTNLGRPVADETAATTAVSFWDAGGIQCETSKDSDRCGLAGHRPAWVRRQTSGGLWPERPQQPQPLQIFFPGRQPAAAGLPATGRPGFAGVPRAAGGRRARSGRLPSWPGSQRAAEDHVSERLLVLEEEDSWDALAYWFVTTFVCQLVHHLETWNKYNDANEECFAHLESLYTLLVSPLLHSKLTNLFIPDPSVIGSIGADPQLVYLLSEVVTVLTYCAFKSQTRDVDAFDRILEIAEQLQPWFCCLPEVYAVQPPEVLAAQSEDLTRALVPFSCCDPRILSDFIQSVTAAYDDADAAAAEDNAVSTSEALGVVLPENPLPENPAGLHAPETSTAAEGVSAADVPMSEADARAISKAKLMSMFDQEALAKARGKRKAQEGTSKETLSEKRIILSEEEVRNEKWSPVSKNIILDTFWLQEKGELNRNEVYSQYEWEMHKTYEAKRNIFFRTNTASDRAPPPRYYPKPKEYMERQRKKYLAQKLKDDLAKEK
ncbi:hypothetical protein KSP40_PGU013442 [Platanthera guangdongensis]|uniref:Uncharacterized protein n=1 Tax=Platanthera guangdongensis TaxID=2320717 RepID=A0ABR2LIF4_9ASPA